MIDASNGTDLSSQTIDSGTSTPASTETAAEERYLKQSDVNKLVGSVKQEARQQGYNRALAEFETRQQPQSQVQNQPVTPQMSQEELRATITQEVVNAQQQMQQKQMFDAVTNDFINKVTAGHQKYPDFEQVVGPLALDRNPALVALTASVDNTADVLYALANNRGKIGSLMGLIGNPSTQHLAFTEINDLSHSIKENENALNARVAPSPLNQLDHTSIGTDNGPASVADLRRNPKFFV